jgi:hypothetical protein
VSAFARRAGLAVPDNPSRQLGDLLGSFLLPVLGDLKEGTSREGTWPPGGPWR